MNQDLDNLASSEHQSKDTETGNKTCLKSFPIIMGCQTVKATKE
jgi:hypothetical protein